MDRATSTEEILAAVGEALAGPLALRRVSLRRLLPGTTDVEIIALWSAGRTPLTPGVRMPLRATSLVAVVASGQPELRSHVRPEDGLLHQILSDEGIRSYASVPLGDTAAGHPVLSLSSSRPDAFDDSQRELVTGLGTLVAGRLATIGPGPARP